MLRDARQWFWRNQGHGKVSGLETQQPGLWLTVVARPMLRAFGVCLHPGGTGSVVTAKQLSVVFVVFTKKDSRI